jgi:hypothetical protein
VARRRLLHLCPCTGQAPRAARRRPLLLRRAFECLGSSCGSSTTTSPTPCVRVPRLLVRLVVDYFIYVVHLALAQLLARFVVDHFAYTARSGASAPRPARHQLLNLRRASSTDLAPRAANRRPLCLRRASGCLGTFRGSSSTTPPRASSSSTTSPTPRV